MDEATTTVLVSVATSSVVAAMFTGLLAGRNERKKQLLESRRLLAGEFAGEAMGALAKLRRYKPTTGPNHRNSKLHALPDLRAERAEAADDAIDRLRPLRGRVWVTFPGRSTVAALSANGPRTTCDHAERVIDALRDLYEICDEFWSKCECEQHPDQLRRREAVFDQTYDAAKRAAWDALDRFADSAAEWLERRALTLRR
jgi:sugar phosphate isomerase/epimerase